MNFLMGLGASGVLVWEIAVPFFRFVSSLLFAFAISKDCKSRDNGSTALWGLFTFFSPLIAGAIYWFYSRYLITRKPVSENDFKLANQSKKLFVAAVFFYILTGILLVCSVIVTVASAFALEFGAAYE